MTNVLKIETIENKIIETKGQKILLDFDAAEIYGVETKRINEAVKNNKDKFPNDYLFALTDEEFDSLRSKISTTKISKTRVLPKAFTEKGLYMLAAILKSKTATQTTIDIIETFAKVRNLTNTVKQLSQNPEKEQQQSLMQKGGQIIANCWMTVCKQMQQKPLSR